MVPTANPTIPMNRTTTKAIVPASPETVVLLLEAVPGVAALEGVLDPAVDVPGGAIYSFVLIRTN